MTKEDVFALVKEARDELRAKEEADRKREEIIVPKLQELKQLLNYADIESSITGLSLQILSLGRAFTYLANTGYAQVHQTAIISKSLEDIVKEAIRDKVSQDNAKQ